MTGEDDGMTGVTGGMTGLDAGMIGVSDDWIGVDETLDPGSWSGMTGEDAGMTGSTAGVMTEAGAAVAPVPFSICFMISSVTQVAPMQIFSVWTSLAQREEIFTAPSCTITPNFFKLALIVEVNLSKRLLATGFTASFISLA